MKAGFEVASLLKIKRTGVKGPLDLFENSLKGVECSKETLACFLVVTTKITPLQSLPCLQKAQLVLDKEPCNGSI